MKKLLFPLMFLVVALVLFFNLRATEAMTGFVAVGQTAAPLPNSITYAQVPGPLIDVPFDCTSNPGAARSCDLIVAVINRKDPANWPTLVAAHARIAVNGVVIFDYAKVPPQ